MKKSKKEEKRDYQTDKLIMDLFVSLEKKERKRFVAGLSKKQKKELVAMIQRRVKV